MDGNEVRGGSSGLCGESEKMEGLKKSHGTRSNQSKLRLILELI